MKRSIRGTMASCVVAAGLLLAGGPAGAQTKVIHVHGTQVRVDHNDNLPTRETRIDVSRAARAPQQRTDASIQAAAPSPTARFVTHNGRTYQLDAGGRLIGAYAGTADAASLNARLSTGSGLLTSDPSRISTPGSGYDQASALRASQGAVVMGPGPQNPNLGVTTGTMRPQRVQNTPDQNVLNNGVATGPMGQFFYPGGATGYFDSPLFPTPGNLTVGTPYPGQVTLSTGANVFGPGVSAGFVGPSGVYYNAATYFNASNIPISVTPVSPTATTSPISGTTTTGGGLTTGLPATGTGFIPTSGGLFVPAGVTTLPVTSTSGGFTSGLPGVGTGVLPGVGTGTVVPGATGTGTFIPAGTGR